MYKILPPIALIICLGIGCNTVSSVSEPESASLQYFALDQVELLESPFYHAQELDKKYLLDLEADRLLAPFLREAGLEPKAESYTNWENTGLDGHIGGHYVTALSLMYASTGDADIRARLDYMIAELKKCQDANGNGYLGGVPGGKTIWDEIAAGNIRAGAFSLNDKWVPLYNIHKTYAGLRDAWLYAGSETAREMLIKMTDWAIALVAQLSDEQIQDMLRSEHGGLNETFADVAAITGDEKYLQLAQQFSDRSILDPLLRKEDFLTGKHANTQIPKVIGYERIANINGDSSWTDAARFFWDEVVAKRSVCIGGNSAYEHFHPEDDFSRMIQGTQGPETCNTYNMLRLSKMLFQNSLDAKYIDYYERALYNHILSSQHPETGGLVYFTQMRPGHYRVYSQPHTSFWCCVGSGIENHGKYGEMIYAHAGDALYVNLFIPSRLQWQEKGVEIVQENRFPEEAATTLRVHSPSATEFSLKVRQPSWIGSEGLQVQVNGEAVANLEQEGAYLSISRKWKDGDKVSIQLPMKWEAEQLPDGSNYYAFLYGPLVMAAKMGTEGMEGLFADDSRGGHIAQGDIIPLKEIPIVVSPARELLTHVQAVPGEPLRFALSGLYPAAYQAGLELMPFYQLHEARYILYFPQADQQELQAMQERMAAQEAAARQLDAITEDVVTCGEQQPESDHFMEQKDSWSGYMYEHHWREGPGWFTYAMRNGEQQAKFLYVKYLDVDKARKAEVFINDEAVGEIWSDAAGEEHLATALLPIPDRLQQEKTMNVKMQSADKLWMPKTAEVRLLSEEPK
jgi:hypothetical protein